MAGHPLCLTAAPQVAIISVAAAVLEPSVLELSGPLRCCCHLHAGAVDLAETTQLSQTGCSCHSVQRHECLLFLVARLGCKFNGHTFIVRLK